MRKKGVSVVIASVMIILITVMAVAVIWAFILPLIDGAIEREARATELSRENIEMSNLAFYTDAAGEENVNITIKRGVTEMIGFELELITETITVNESVPIDIVLAIDLSGSMRTNYDGQPENRITRAKVATIDFMDTVINTNSLAKVGLVGFKWNLIWGSNENSEVHNLSNNLGSLGDEVDSWTATGGTYVCKAIEKSLEVFNWNSETGREKVLIILGDGATSISSCKNGGANNLAASLFQDYNISTSTIGFGPGGAIPFYEDLAIAGNGEFYDSSDTSMLASTFTSIINNINITSEIRKEIPLKGVYLTVIITAGGESYPYDISEQLPGSNGAKRFTIPLPEGVSQDEITLIEIILSNLAQGKITTSRILDTWKPNN